MSEETHSDDDVTDLELATVLGRVYRGNVSTLPPHRILKNLNWAVLRRLDEAMVSIETMYDFVCHTHNVFFKGDDDVFIAFFSQYPLDSILIQLHARPSLLRDEMWVHDMLLVIREAFRVHGSERHSVRFSERLAAGLPIVDALAHSSPQPCVCMAPCIRLLRFVCGVSRDMIRDERMFRLFAIHIHDVTLQPLLLTLIEEGEFHEDTPLVEDIFVSLIMLTVQSSRPSSLVIDALERMLRRNSDLRTERYVFYTAQLWRTGWNVVLGPVLAHLLNTTDFAFVIELEHINKLSSLILCAHTHASLEWRAVRASLRYIVPARVCETLHETRREPQVSTSSSCTCPITLHAIENPVILSDGHTYERDAIMRHFASKGFVSPMTRQSVTCHVVPNRAVVTDN